MADSLNPFRGDTIRMFTAQTVASSNSLIVWPARRKDENGRSMVVDTSAGTFTFQIQAKLDADSPWFEVPIELPDGTIQINLNQADLNAADQITVRHDLWPRMRHRITGGAGHSIDTWMAL